MELFETIEFMLSSNPDKRFKAEYNQLTIRLDSLWTLLKGYRENKLPFTPSCSYELLECQYVQMYRYRECLRKRALMEGIELEEEI